MLSLFQGYPHALRGSTVLLRKITSGQLPPKFEGVAEAIQLHLQSTFSQGCHFVNKVHRSMNF